MWLDFQAILICLTIFLFLTWLSQAVNQLPPGPLGWPILGYLPNLGISLYYTGMEPYRMFAEMSAKYGKVYSLYLGSKLVVILNGYECIREAFRNPHLNDRPVMHGFPTSNLGILLSSGKLARYQRRFTLQKFRTLGIGKSSFLDKISEETEFLIQEFKANNAKDFDPSECISNALANIIGLVIFGKRFNYMDDNFHRIVKIFDKQAELAGNGSIVQIIPILLYFRPSLKQWMHQSKCQVRSFIREIIEDHKTMFDSSNLRDYIDVYLAELKKSINNSKNTNQSFITESNLMQTVAQLFPAGFETTVTTLRWSLLFMLAFPEIQSRVQKEIDSVVGRNRLPRMDDDLPFTEATIMEIQRFASILPLGVPHAAAEDTVLQGYIIPKGTLILCNIWAVHHDPQVWKDPEQFRPERFLDVNGNVWQPQEYMPFSTGHRKCVGENLAKMELFIVLTHLLHQFTFEKPPDVTEVSFTGTLGVTNAPSPYRIVAKHRN